MTIDQMRVYISQHPKYKDSPKWRDRCLNQMSDNQVIAVYGKFSKEDYSKIKKEMKAQGKDDTYQQMTVWDY